MGQKTLSPEAFMNELFAPTSGSRPFSRGYFGSMLNLSIVLKVNENDFRKLDIGMIEKVIVPLSAIRLFSQCNIPNFVFKVIPSDKSVEESLLNLIDVSETKPSKFVLSFSEKEIEYKFTAFLDEMKTVENNTRMHIKLNHLQKKD